MQEWIYSILNSGELSFSVLIACFLLGVIGSVTSCCNLAIIGAVAGYSGSIGVTKGTRSVWISGISFLFGIIFSLSLVGAVMGYLSSMMSLNMGVWWKIAAGILSIFFGMLTLNILPFKIPSVSISRKSQGGFLSSLFFGLAIGGITVACNSCCNPTFPIILGASFIKGSVLWGVLFLAIFGLGYGLPLAAAMIGIGIGIGKLTSVFNKISVWIKYIAGLILIIVGFYFLLTL